MSAVPDNSIWRKAELALVHFVTNNNIGVNEANIFAGHDNGEKQVPCIVCECTDGEPEITGKPTGNWICQCVITLTTKLHDETGEDASGRFASIMDSFIDSTAASVLSSADEFFTVLQSQVTGFEKRTQGDELIGTIKVRLTCCGSVII